MNSRKDENLKELFEKFMNPEQAESSLEDIQKAEQILSEHPAPEPDSMLIANIKAEIAMRLPAKRTNTFTRTAYRVTCAAATILIISAISIILFDNSTRIQGPPVSTLIPPKIWDTDDITTDDADLANYAIEIEQIEEELRSLRSGEEAGNVDSISELEMELVAINNDFWKE